MLRHRTRLMFSGRLRLVLIGLVLSMPGPGRVWAEGGRSVAADTYQRPDAQTIASLADEIASNPQFRPRTTFAQWLKGKLGRWNRSRLKLPEGAGDIIMFVLMLWCILALLAILAHLGWTIWLLTRSGGGRSARGSNRDLPADEITSSDRLWERSRELAGAGAFRDAIGVVLLALLRQLEALEVVSFHKSKTNGEYVREYPPNLPGRGAFQDFVSVFERTIYGGLPVARPTYETMVSTAQRIIDDVGQNSQI